MESYMLYPSKYTFPVFVCINKEFSVNICKPMSENKKSMKDVFPSFRCKF